jgi:hypothetical protein
MLCGASQCASSIRMFTWHISSLSLSSTRLHWNPPTLCSDVHMTHISLQSLSSTRPHPPCRWAPRTLWPHERQRLRRQLPCTPQSRPATAGAAASCPAPSLPPSPWSLPATAVRPSEAVRPACTRVHRPKGCATREDLLPTCGLSSSGHGWAPATTPPSLWLGRAHASGRHPSSPTGRCEPRPPPPCSSLHHFPIPTCNAPPTRVFCV